MGYKHRKGMREEKLSGVLGRPRTKSFGGKKPYLVNLRIKWSEHFDFILVILHVIHNTRYWSVVLGIEEFFIEVIKITGDDNIFAYE
jgi:hypothetical protein